MKTRRWTFKGEAKVKIKPKDENESPFEIDTLDGQKIDTYDEDELDYWYDEFDEDDE